MVAFLLNCVEFKSIWVLASLQLLCCGVLSLYRKTNGASTVVQKPTSEISGVSYYDICDVVWHRVNDPVNPDIHRHPHPDSYIGQRKRVTNTYETITATSGNSSSSSSSSSSNAYESLLYTGGQQPTDYTSLRRCHDTEPPATTNDDDDDDDMATFRNNYLRPT